MEFESELKYREIHVVNREKNISYRHDFSLFVDMINNYMVGSLDGENTNSCRTTFLSGKHFCPVLSPDYKIQSLI